jgi:hypothetical protein
MKTLAVWIKGLIAGAIGGGLASAITVCQNSPETVMANPSSLILPAAVGAASVAVPYLMKSPLK